MKNKIDIQDRILDIEGFIGYFQENIQNNSTFLPELEAAHKVCRILKRQTILKKEIYEIVKIINDMNETDHYDGSGWNSFVHRILWLTKEFGFKSKLTRGNRFIELEE